MHILLVDLVSHRFCMKKHTNLGLRVWVRWWTWDVDFCFVPLGSVFSFSRALRGIFHLFLLKYFLQIQVFCLPQVLQDFRSYLPSTPTRYSHYSSVTSLINHQNLYFIICSSNPFLRFWELPLPYPCVFPFVFSRIFWEL